MINKDTCIGIIKKIDTPILIDFGMARKCNIKN